MMIREGRKRKIYVKALKYHLKSTHGTLFISSFLRKNAKVGRRGVLLRKKKAFYPLAKSSGPGLVTSSYGASVFLARWLALALLVGPSTVFPCGAAPARSLAGGFALLPGSCGFGGLSSTSELSTFG